jgi:hypothetical protein
MYSSHAGFTIKDDKVGPFFESFQLLLSPSHCATFYKRQYSETEVNAIIKFYLSDFLSFVGGIKELIRHDNKQIGIGVDEGRIEISSSKFVLIQAHL